MIIRQTILEIYDCLTLYEQRQRQRQRRRPMDPLAKRRLSGGLPKNSCMRSCLAQNGRYIDFPAVLLQYIEVERMVEDFVNAFLL